MPPGRSEIIDSLQRQLQKGLRSTAAEPIASGCRGLDSLIGFRAGTLVEWLGEEGGGATTLATVLARQVCGDARPLVVVDQQRRIYPPALAAMGIDLRRVVFVFPASPREYEWTLSQAMSCPAVAAVLCWPRKLGDRAFRRLQLSAEQSGSLGLLVRPASALHEPSWAEARLFVEPVPCYGRRRFKISVLRCGGGAGGRTVEVEISEEGLLHETHPLHPVSPLAAATTVQRAARA